MDLLQSLILPPSQTPNSLSSATNPSAASATAPAAPPTTTEWTGPDTSNICFFYYHMGDCRRDVSRVMLAPGEHPCPFAHEVPDDATPETVKIQYMPQWRYHKRACGLPLCAWKDEVWAPQETAKMDQGETARVSQGETPATLAGVGKKRRRNETKAAAEEMEVDLPLQPDAELTSNKKRKSWMYHPARPSFQADERTEISYDDLGAREPSPPTSPPSVLAASPLRDVRKPARKTGGKSDKTCFFW